MKTWGKRREGVGGVKMRGGLQGKKDRRSITARKKKTEALRRTSRDGRWNPVGGRRSSDGKKNHNGARDRLPISFARKRGKGYLSAMETRLKKGRRPERGKREGKIEGEEEFFYHYRGKKGKSLGKKGKCLSLMRGEKKVR